MFLGAKYKFKAGNNNRVAVNCMVERGPIVMTLTLNWVILMHLILLNVACKNKCFRA